MTRLEIILGRLMLKLPASAARRHDLSRVSAQPSPRNELSREWTDTWSLVSWSTAGLTRSHRQEISILVYVFQFDGEHSECL
jgi:hypothetical protein